MKTGYVGIAMNDNITAKNSGIIDTLDRMLALEEKRYFDRYPRARRPVLSIYLDEETYRDLHRHASGALAGNYYAFLHSQTYMGYPIFLVRPVYIEGTGIQRTHGLKVLWE